MRRTSAIICEFNPFHNGHLRLIEDARKKGSDGIVCIMSGNFVQRAEIAAADKYTRAKAALLSGADLVLELPMPFSAASAEYFARTGVYIAEKLGCVDELLFGSESGDIESLTTIAKNQLSEEFVSRFWKLYTGENGYAASAQMAYEELYGKNDALSSPNNILAVEYIKALTRLKSNILPRTIAREGDFHSDELSGKYPSATALRRLIYENGLEEAEPHMPSKAFDALLEAKKKGIFPICADKYGFAVLSAMRLGDKKNMAECEGICGGLENRIIQSALLSKDYAELLSRIATKKYTDARIRRALLFSLLGIIPSDMSLRPFYVYLLAANAKGRELLSDVRRKGSISVATKMSDKKSVISLLDDVEREDAERLFEIEKRSEALFTLCLPEAKEAGFFEKMTPFVVQ